MTDKARGLIAAMNEVLADGCKIPDTMAYRIAADNALAALRTAPEVRCITVRVDGEYGTFYLREGVEGEGDRMYYWCQLTCNTSFGVVGYHWGSMGGPAAWFFAKISIDYLLGKLWGMNDQVLDGDGTLAEFKADIIRERRSGDIDADIARERWDGLPDSIDDDVDLHRFADSADWVWQGLSEGGYVRKMTNPQAAGFARVLWPEFLRQLAAAQEGRDEI